MKNTLGLALFGLLSLILFSCNDDQSEVIQTKTVPLTFNIATHSGDVGSKTSVIPDEAMLILTYTKNGGTQETKTIPFEIAGDQLISKPIGFTPGRYTIDDFMIVQGTDILFATPKRGSQLGGTVESPVDHQLIITNENAIDLRMDVINVAMKQPKDFGFKSFKIKNVKPIRVSVLTGSGKKSYTDAEAQIVKDGVVISSHSLTAKVNSIPFEGDVDSVYTLVVTKDGYATSRQQFTYSSLTGKPWEIVLNPAFKMHIRALYIEETPFEFFLDGTGTVYVSGAGPFSGPRALPWYEENFSLDGEYDIEITGDIGNITKISSFGYNAGIETLSGLQHMPELTEFDPGWYLDDAVDLTHNTKLEAVELQFVRLPQFVELPAEHNISLMSLYQWDRPTTADELDYILNNLYANATNRNIRNGSIFLNNNESISDNTRMKAAALQAELGWRVEIEEPYE
jgi:hypothetical protein